MGTVNAQNKTYDPILHYSYYSFFHSLGLRSTLFVLLFRTLFVSFSPFIFLSVFSLHPPDQYWNLCVRLG